MSIIDDYIADHPDMSSRDVAAMVGCSKSHVNDVRRRMQTVTKQTAVILGDIHAPYHDEQALDLAMDHALSLDPDVLVLNGDFADFYQISAWKNDPSRMSYDKERDIAKQMLANVASVFPRARKVFIPGNHELRLEKLLWDGSAKKFGNRLTLETELGIEASGFECYDNVKLVVAGEAPFSIGGLYIAHGHEARVSVGAVRPAKLYYEKMLVPIVVSHTHHASFWPAKTFDGRVIVSHSTGCLCRLAEPYAPANKWVHGFCVANIYSDGTHDVTNHMILNGRVV